MQNCSKLFTANTSKPYISSTPMWAWLGPDPTNEALTPPTMLWKSTAYKCLASPSLALKACEGWRGGGEGEGRGRGGGEGSREAGACYSNQGWHSATGELLIRQFLSKGLGIHNNVSYICSCLQHYTGPLRLSSSY